MNRSGFVEVTHRVALQCCQSQRRELGAPVGNVGRWHASTNHARMSFRDACTCSKFPGGLHASIQVLSASIALLAVGSKIKHVLRHNAGLWINRFLRYPRPPWLETLLRASGRCSQRCSLLARSLDSWSSPTAQSGNVKTFAPLHQVERHIVEIQR